MTTIVTRTVKGSALTWAEGDANFNNLNNDKVEGVDGVAALRLLSPSTGLNVHLNYHTTAGDGGHGPFRALTGSAPGTYTDDNGITIVPTGGDGSSCWRRVGASARIDARWYGYKADNSTDNTSVLHGIRDHLVATYGYGVIDLPSGIGKANFVFKSGIILNGAGIYVTTLAPYSAGHTVTNILTENVTNIGISNMLVKGDTADATNTGVHFEAPKRNGLISWLDGVYMHNIAIEDCGNRGLALIGTSNTANYGFIQKFVSTGILYVENTEYEGFYLEGSFFEGNIQSFRSYLVGNTGGRGHYIGQNVATPLGLPQRLSFGQVNFTGSGIDTYASGGLILEINHAREIEMNASNMELNDTGATAPYFMYIHGSRTEDIKVHGNFQNDVALDQAFKIDQGKNIQISGRCWGTATVTNGVYCPSRTDGSLVDLDISRLTFDDNYTTPYRGSANYNELTLVSGTTYLVTDHRESNYLPSGDIAITAINGGKHGETIRLVAKAVPSYWLADNETITLINGDFRPKVIGESIDLRCESTTATIKWREVARSHPVYKSDRLSTTDATVTSLPFQGVTGLPVGTNATWNFEADIVARDQANNQQAAYKIVGVIEKGATAASTGVWGVVTTAIYEDDATWTATAVADTTNGRLDIQVTGAVGKTVKWKCVISLTEMNNY